MKILCLLVIFSLVPLYFYGQNTILEGTVKDSLDNPIELANVMAFYKKDSTVASFGVSDATGRYRLILTQGEVYTLKSSFLGYTTWESEIKAEDDMITQDLVLSESSQYLDEVEITYEFPITVSGDTITYKADAFAHGNERKLGDVLESLPGFEIDENGDIKVQGKRVDKVLVEGKEFFDGDSKMATQNIPANAVDKIQLLRNYSNVTPMSGLGNDESLAINVQLDEDKKNLWFGDVEVSVGPEERYLVHPNLFYYSPKININMIGDANNVGQQPFTLRDYFRFSGGMRNIGGNSGSSINLSSDEFGISLMQNDMARNINTKLGAVNMNYQPNKKWRWSVYGIASSIETLMRSTSNRTYIRSQENTLEDTESILNQENISGLFKLSSAYTPNPKTHLEYEGFLKASTISEIDDRTSDFGSMSNTFREQDEKTPFSLDQNLLGYFTLNENNILSAETSWGYKRQIPTYNLISTIYPLQETLTLIDSEVYNILQDRTITTNALKAELNHYYIINKTNHINFTAGLNNSYQQFDSHVEQQLDDGSVVADNALNNSVSYQFQDYYTGVHYKMKLGKLTLSPGINWHTYHVSDEQLDTRNTFSKQLIMPDLFAKYDFRNSENVTFNYNLAAQFTDVQNVAANSVVRNYNSSFVGNRNIENILYHQINVNYFNFNIFNHINLFGVVNYQKRYNDINENIRYSGTNRISSPQNVPVWNDRLTSRISFEKKFVHFKTKTGVQLNYANFQNEVELQSNENSSLTQEYSLSVESKFINAPNFEIGFKKGWNIYNTNNVRQEYTTNTPYMDIEVAFLKSFTLVADYEFNNYKNDEGLTLSNYDFMNASLYYEKEDSPWEFKLSANNLLETTFIRRDGFSDNVVSTLSYQVLPRYILFSVKYNL